MSLWNPDRAMHFTIAPSYHRLVGRWCDGAKVKCMALSGFHMSFRILRKEFCCLNTPGSSYESTIDRFIAPSRYRHRVIAPSRNRSIALSRHRVIVIAPSHHRVIVIAPSRHRHRTIAPSHLQVDGTMARK